MAPQMLRVVGVFAWRRDADGPVFYCGYGRWCVQTDPADGLIGVGYAGGQQQPSAC